MTIVSMDAIRARVANGTDAESILRWIIRSQHGVFSRRQATAAGLTDRQLRYRSDCGALRVLFPGVLAAADHAETDRMRTHGALLWGGDQAALAGCTALAAHAVDDIAHRGVDLAVGPGRRRAPEGIRVVRAASASLMPVLRGGLRVAGVEAALVGAAACQGADAFEIAFEHARRIGRTSPAAMAAYLDRFGRSGRNGVGVARRILGEVAAFAPAESLLEVRADQLLRSQRWLPRPERQVILEWDGTAYRFDFVWRRHCVVLETNGRRWHGDPTDFERDHQKWSVPGALRFKLVMATWRKVVERPDELLDELAGALGVRRL